MKYLKQILLILAILITSLSGAQSKVQLGVDIFGGLANQYTKASTDFIPHYGTALTGSFKIKENLYLQTGVGYERKGHKGAGGESDISIYDRANFKTLVTYDYIFAPLNFRYFISNNSNYSIKVGFYGAYLINGEMIVDGYHYVNDVQKELKFTVDLIEHQNNLRRFDFGLDLGFQQKIITVKDFIFELGIYGRVGLLRVDTSPDVKFKNYVLGVNLSINKKI